MSCRHNQNSSYFTNLVSAARQNTKEKSRIAKGNYMKVNVMCIPMRGSVGAEVHEGEDQIITVVYGCAVVKLGNTQRKADCVRRLMAGDSVFIPAGMWHNVCNVGNGPLKLISVYGYGSQRNDCGHVANACESGQTANTCGCGQAANDCGCDRTADACDCGCAQEANKYDSPNNYEGMVFSANEYHWNKAQVQEESCSCGINSGC